MERDKKSKSTGVSSGVLFGLAGLAVGFFGKYVYDELTQDQKEMQRDKQEHLRDIRENNKRNKKDNNENNENTTTENTDCIEYEAFFCPISQEIMKDPVITPHGISYERQSILAWLKKCDTCPITKHPLKHSDLITNYALKNTIDDYLKKSQSQK